MTHVVDPAAVFNAGAATLYVLLGVWVLTLTPRRRQTTLLAAFTITFGLAGLIALTEIYVLHDAVRSPLFELSSPIILVNGLAAIALASLVPGPLEDRRLLVAAGGIALLFTTALSFPDWVGAGTSVSWLLEAGALVGDVGLYAASALAALRARPARDPSRGDVVQLALLSVAFAVLFSFFAGANIGQVAQAVARGAVATGLRELLVLVAWPFIASIWLSNMIQADEENVRTHRAAALAILGTVALGGLYFALFPESRVPFLFGVFNTLGVGLLAYGVLRHDLAGLDAKVEWGLSKTTVAGIFVAVFFIVSEGAQELFSGFAGSEWLGILAAGALLFALAPIQRAADRIAAKAVPGGEPGDERAPAARYRTAVETALADGRITRDEEAYLAELADDLGLSAKRTFEIRSEAEDEQQVGGPSR